MSYFPTTLYSYCLNSLTNLLHIFLRTGSENNIQLLGILLHLTLLHLFIFPLYFRLDLAFFFFLVAFSFYILLYFQSTSIL